ncbi:hypothetical protein SAMN05216319_3243 [Duganella sp. CF402]|uniref:hypothetical protein n=1 Tax=unclassified Duganella TaxID=2636909 RepID=UPI0008C1F466|nr:MULTISPECIES: hypothetical protein [unclassified Duganella]RZT08343.1 hypothetical protein EV582_0375 [Duganella sp. BK701]SEL97328.1 hypothetical protein SAMN05216319_3243 [Duganella sp. CF402]
MRLCLPLLLCCATAVAAAPDKQDQDTLQTLRIHLTRSFELSPELPLDADLRARANELSAAHLERISALLPAWLAEERKLQSASGKPAEPSYVYFALWARLLNELALWQLEPGDAAYEQATVAALGASPLQCNLHNDSRFTDYAARIARIQQLPAAQRPAMLAAERESLARWGQPRPAPAAWPEPLPQQAALALLAPGQKDRPALPPTLAAQLLSEKKDYATMAREDQCLLQLWWFKRSLQQGVAPAIALSAFRYGTMISADVRFAGMFEPPSAVSKPAPAAATGKPPFPPIATRFQAGGATVVQFKQDASGKTQQASVVARNISVPGIRGVRPVAFETLFDAQTLKYAMDNKLPAGGAVSKLQLVWKMEDKQP